MVLVGTAHALPIYDIQYTTDPSGDSPYAGQVVTITGVVTGSAYNGYFVADAPGPWNAIFVYTYDSGPDVGDEVQLTGTVAEYYNLTEITDVTAYQLLSSDNPVVPELVTTGTLSQEMYECVLVSVENVSVVSLESYGEWIVDDGSGGVYCDDWADYMYFPAVGDDLASLTGILQYNFGLFKLAPRSTGDIVAELIPHYALYGDVVTMNDSRDILLDVYVEILGDRIVDIHTTAPVGIPSVAVPGLIFPGLIDSHNHPPYNVLDLIPFGTFFGERSDWQGTPLYDEFRDQYYGIQDYGGADAMANNMFKLAEVRALCAGTTMMQGRNCNGHYNDPFAHQGMVITNAERFPSRCYSSTFPLNDSQSWWQNLAAEPWDRFLVHLSEGITAGALNEFYTWQGWGMLDERTSVIHGVPYTAPEWTAMATAGASLIWSPASNMTLYNATADIPGALAAGVNVSLAPDWTESGTLNVLQEMKFANELSIDQWGGLLTPLQLTEFVTRNAADALGVEDRVGRIAAGYQADVAVFLGDPGTPYDDLLAAESKDVLLTVVSGRPMYGDPALMAQFDFLTDLEDVTVGGQPKQVGIQVAAHGIEESDKPLLQIIAELQAAYDATFPQICDFLSIERDVEDAVLPARLDDVAVHNYPDPFNPATTIRYHVPTGEPTSLRIYDLSGRLVHTLVDMDEPETGWYETTWNGRDEAGRKVASGVYFAHLSVGSSTRTDRMALMK